jgi:hypothetical protein
LAHESQIIRIFLTPARLGFAPRLLFFFCAGTCSHGPDIWTRDRFRISSCFLLVRIVSAILSCERCPFYFLFIFIFVFAPLCFGSDASPPVHAPHVGILVRILGPALGLGCRSYHSGTTVDSASIVMPCCSFFFYLPASKPIREGGREAAWSQWSFTGGRKHSRGVTRIQGGSARSSNSFLPLFPPSFFLPSFLPSRVFRPPLFPPHLNGSPLLFSSCSLPCLLFLQCIVLYIIYFILESICASLAARSRRRPRSCLRADPAPDCGRPSARFSSFPLGHSLSIPCPRLRRTVFFILFPNLFVSRSGHGSPMSLPRSLGLASIDVNMPSLCWRTFTSPRTDPDRPFGVCFEAPASRLAVASGPAASHSRFVLGPRAALGA